MSGLSLLKIFWCQVGPEHDDPTSDKCERELWSRRVYLRDWHCSGKNKHKCVHTVAKEKVNLDLIFCEGEDPGSEWGDVAGSLWTIPQQVWPGDTAGLTSWGWAGPSSDNAGLFLFRLKFLFNLLTYLLTHIPTLSRRFPTFFCEYL